LIGNGRNKLIDGWRGLSVVLVVIGHVVSYRFLAYWDIRPLHDVLGSPVLLIENIIFRLASELGETGVQFFFVISGFLITKLLGVEESRNGKISIGAFYVRRIFRIMPAFYFYLLIVLVLRNGGMILANDDAFFRSGLYVCNLSGFKCSWWLAHTWSLSVEEQFYLIWPLGFVALGRTRAAVIVCALIALMIGSYSFFDLTSFAHIAIGALFAISATARDWVARFATTGAILIAGAVLILKPLAFPMPHVANVIQAATPLLTAFVFFGTVSMRGGPLLQIVSNPLLQKVGVVSFSVYLWQQLSLAPFFWGGSETGAARLYENNTAIIALLFIPVAILSYFLVERPMIKIGHKVSNRIIGRNTISEKRSLEAS
jgi:peptidoglycan/LPS O-acetylase OafA/YrhL